MLISFSEASMLPYIRAGIRQARGEDVRGERVKRQTIRGRGQRAEKLLACDPVGHTIPYSLDLWWKSRTPEREHLGGIDCSLVRVWPIEIWHSFIEYTDGSTSECIRINGPRGWRDGDAVLFWSPGDAAGAFAAEAYADGFDSPEAFRDYFVPNRGDRFDAVLFKW
ncbi:hypothetical protein DYI24_19855 [Rhodopseudomonas sp. BR0C11]|uniref:hypothetical protein n=1 Tax=Rhodopseudomonas sp. BR0C11 TaxID=2269370 RepID=UPI0013DFFB21|nr:hypothetical protein [Rhodopseudomonas sp. BR0C11]NEV79289.1 hypothetical protein [Rhodopseudomonas sp. BR0C11]